MGSYLSLADISCSLLDRLWISTRPEVKDDEASAEDLVGCLVRDPLDG